MEDIDPAAMASRTLFPGLLEAGRCLRRGKLERAHAALRKVAAALPPQQLDGGGSPWWAREVRSLCYDMEDALNDDDTHRPAAAVPANKLRLFLDRMMLVFRTTRKKNIAMASSSMTEGFMARIKNLLDTYDECAHPSIVQLVRSTVGRVVDPRLPSPCRHVDDRDLVGMDHARDELIRLLKQEADDGHQTARKTKTVVSVLGSAGLGKTTLAEAVYGRLKAQFDCCAFVCAGADPIMDHVLKRILRDLDSSRYKDIIWKTMAEGELVREIRRFLGNKRYLVVVDDVWYPQHWQRIDQALPENGSRVIMTTRNPRVAAQADGGVCRLEPLSDADSKKLLFKILFGGEGNNCSSPDENRLAAVPDSVISHKCGGGSPLAVIAMASVVASRSPEQWWSAAVSYSIDFSQEAGPWCTDDKYEQDMRRVLASSYYDLPCLLRLCLMHLSAFPKDYLVDKDTLIWRWVAEGFVQQDDHRADAEKTSSKSLYELGESYFNELVNRGMVQTCIQGRRCRVHPMMLSLVRYFSSQENFVTVLDRHRRHSCPYARRHTRCDCGLSPRLAMHATGNITNIEAAVGNRLNMGRMRSFDARRLCCIDEMPQLLGSFQAVRLLALEHCRGGAVGTEHLKQIGKLRHLRYLGLLGTRVADELPAAEAFVGGLRLLQTLDLRGTGIKALPPAVFELGQLMCLCVDGASVDGSGQWSQMGKLASLEEVRLCCSNGDDTSSYLEHLEAVLHNLTELRVIEISGLDRMDGTAMDALVRCLPKLKKIQRLALRYKGDDLAPVTRIARSFSR